MFDWFWNFLYSLTKSILRIIDGLMACANKLCGIEDITVDGESTDFLTYLLKSSEVQNAFIVAAVLGLVVLVFFTVLSIIRLIAKEKPDMTPAQVCVKAFKSVLIFMFIPAIMLIGTWVANVFMQALYKATLTDGTSVGSFLFTAFADEAWYNADDAAKFINGTYNYLDTDVVRLYLDLEEYDFFASWVAGIVILWNIAWALLVFVDRAISIVILYIVSPFSVASSVIDDGSHFKLWREQMLTKYFVGFGTILAVNIYCLIVVLVMKSSMQFFPSSFLNYLCKILFIIGGSLTMKKAMALIGNLVSSGGGSNELRDNVFAGNALGGVFSSGLKTIAGVAGKPFTWGADRLGNSINRGIEDKIGNKLFGSRYGGGHDGTTGDRNTLNGENNANNEENANHNEVNVRGNENLGNLIRNEENNNENNNNNNNNNNNMNDNQLNQNREGAVLNAMNNNNNNGDNNNNNNNN